MKGDKTVNMRDHIKKCDADFRTRLFDIADGICREGIVRIISLSGPTCSGKTTAATMLAGRLAENGKNVNIVSIDDFYYDRDYLHELSLKKGTDSIDYDSIDTIDVEALETFIKEAFTCDEVHSPVFDFKTGVRTGYRAIRTSANDVFIFEGIQAIYPQITRLFRPYGAISVYICPSSSVEAGGEIFEPNEIRLMRRLVRDHNFRNADAEFTMRLWDSVRENEEKNIFPYAHSCAYQIDSSKPYEIGILKPYLENILRDISLNSKYYKRSVEILEKIANVAPIDSALIGDDSLYKEFV